MACVATMQELNARLDRVRAQTRLADRKLLLSLHPVLSLLDPTQAETAKFDCRMPILVNN